MQKYGAPDTNQTCDTRFRKTIGTAFVASVRPTEPNAFNALGDHLRLGQVGLKRLESGTLEHKMSTGTKLTLTVVLST